MGDDYWSLNGTCLVTHHSAPGTKLFSLYDVTSKKPPIQCDCVDIRRETLANLESPNESVMSDTLWMPADHPEKVGALCKQAHTLSASWTGKTTFNLMMNIPKPGHLWCEGEEIECAGDTARPDRITPCNWSQLSRAQRTKMSIASGNLQILEKPLRDLCRKNVSRKRRPIVT